MVSLLKRIEAQTFRLFHREAPRGRLQRIGFWLLALYAFLVAGSLLPNAAGRFAGGLRGWVLFFLLLVYLWIGGRWLFQRLLWKVRNRLIVTYLLMGLAPIVLFATLALIAAYVFSGQFAIFAATSEIHSELAHLEAENQSYAAHIGHLLEGNPRARVVNLPELDDTQTEHSDPGFEVAAFRDGQRMAIEQVPARTQSLELPNWPANGFHGVVLDNGKLYFRAFNTHASGPNQAIVITSLPLNKESADQIAAGLGRVTILPALDFEEVDGTGDRAVPGAGASKRASVRINGRQLTNAGPAPGSVSGGRLPVAEHVYDIPIDFFAPMSVSDWKTGKPHLITIIVNSEPSLVYRKLAIASLQGPRILQDALIGLAIFFALLELVAFIMAVRLNRTITRSVHDLYEATGEVDRGNFSHRIPVRRNDQLAALGSSFNSMTASLERLLEEQREKERLQNELAIAQEVQANLFPRDDILLPTLELHGVCCPARVVSGDYYDFLPFADGGLGLALGDISGKGISAALLMAMLHSAVRAYRCAGEALVTEGIKALRTPAASRLQQMQGSEEIDCGDWLESPARILSLLNRHLYRSTQPEKYATLFLAHYESRSGRLTYSNGGQPPPLLLRPDDTVARLDCGGTVVGLLDGMSYEQDTVQMRAGDILVAYSDGVTEPENDFGEFGEERLLEIVRRHRRQPLPAICEQVLLALRTWIGAQEQPDDITLVLARQQ